MIEKDCGHAWCFYMLLFLFCLDFYLRTNNIPPAIKHGVNVPATIYTLHLRSIFYLPACIRAVLWCKGGSHSGRVGSSKFQLKSKKKIGQVIICADDEAPPPPSLLDNSNYQIHIVKMPPKPSHMNPPPSRTKKNYNSDPLQ